MKGSMLIFVLLICVLLPSQEKLTGRIVGGNNATLGEIPCLLSVHDLRHPEIGSYCSYCLITDQTAIGCAHCLSSYQSDPEIYNRFVLVGGHVDRNEGRVFYMKKLIVHEQYYSSDNEGDISLVILKDPVTTSFTLMPVSLPMPGEEYIGRKAKVAGWGRIEHNNPHPTRMLRVLEVEILPHSTCRPYWSKYVRGKYICASAEGASVAFIVP